PKEEIDEEINFGLWRCAQSQPSPSLSITPGRLFSMSTSDSRTRARATLTSHGFFRLRAIDCLPRFSEAKFSEYPFDIGGQARMPSPSSGSILTTRAP